MENQPKHMSPETSAQLKKMEWERQLETTNPILNTIRTITAFTILEGAQIENAAYLNKRDKHTKLGFDFSYEHSNGIITIAEWVAPENGFESEFKTRIRYRTGEFSLGLNEKFLEKKIIDSFEKPERSEVFTDIHPSKGKETESGILIRGPIDGMDANTTKFVVEFLTRAKEELTR